MFFGIGGCLCLYVAAPYVQGVISKIPRKVREALCVVLIILFFADFIYSSLNPNIGAGITDDNIKNMIEESQNIAE